MFYTVTIELTTEVEDKKGNIKQKRVKERYCIEDETTIGAETRMNEHMKSAVVDWKVVSIAETKYIECILR